MNRLSIKAMLTNPGSLDYLTKQFDAWKRLCSAWMPYATASAAQILVKA